MGGYPYDLYADVIEVSRGVARDWKRKRASRRRYLVEEKEVAEMDEYIRSYSGRAPVGRDADAMGNLS